MPPAVANSDIFLALKALHELEDLQIGDLERWRVVGEGELSAGRGNMSHLGELGVLGKVVIALGLEDALCAREGEREFRSLPSESIGYHNIYIVSQMQWEMRHGSLAAAAHANISSRSQALSPMISHP
jgi:hypothetical protein